MDAMTPIPSRTARLQQRPKIGAEIKKHFADGKWHLPSTIANKIGYDESHVTDTINNIIRHKTFGCKAERRTVGKHVEFRVFPMDRAVSASELSEKLSPIIDELEAQGRVSLAAASPAQVRLLAHRLRLLLDGWTQ